MKPRLSLLWLTAPALVAAMASYAATGEQTQTQQTGQQNMHATKQQNMHVTSEEMKQRCAALHDKKLSAKEKSDPKTRKLMKQCQQIKHGNKTT